MPSSRGASQHRDGTQVFHTTGGFITVQPPGKPKNTRVGSISLLQGYFPTQVLKPVLWADSLPAPSINPNYLSKGSISKFSHIEGQGFKIGIWGQHNSAHIRTHLRIYWKLYTPSKEDCIHASLNFAHNFRNFLEPRLRAAVLRHLPLFPDGETGGSERGSAFQQARRETDLLIPHQVLALPYSALCQAC